MFLKELIEKGKIVKVVACCEEWERLWVTGLSDDSRFVKKGELFFCRRGVNYDTHDFAEEAMRRGAVAVICERELPLSLPQIIVEDGRAAMAMMVRRKQLLRKYFRLLKKLPSIRTQPISLICWGMIRNLFVLRRRLFMRGFLVCCLMRNCLK